jgi:uroporphyrin-III C-methyltransferase / precorrin-2 dehydrogenase / sirohydrochlorin ferrochelatase
MYPAVLSVSGRKCLVVGGGAVALRKVDGLVREKAQVTVVCPEPLAALEQLAAGGAVVLERRPYRPGEAGNYALVLAATDQADVNRQVAADAETAGRWVNVADDPALCTFHIPAQVRRGALKLMVASDGEAPFVASRLRRALEARFGPEWAEWMESAARFRRRVRSLRLTAAERDGAFEAFYRATVNEATFSVRVPTQVEMESLLGLDGSAFRKKETERFVPGGRQRRKELGFVSLVGAGPGDPGLLTVRGRQRLLAAEAVVYDRLAAAALPTNLPPSATLHAVGKEAGNHPVPQEEINALLVRLARDGRRVVRFKGGDPYVFGRGGEEAEALRAAGIPFEIVPGVTSGIAVPAYAGIPVTHRREAVRLTLLTAHESLKDGGPQVQWDLLAKDPHATLVGYMGVTRLPEVASRLIEAGLDPATPAALIERGATSRQRIVRATLRDLPAEVARAGLGPPAVFVIGSTVQHADRLDWYTARPLFGERLVVVAPAGPLGDSLNMAGADVVELPQPISEAARVVLAAMPITGAVLRSVADVDALDEERHGVTWGSNVVAWCLEPSASRRARERGWRWVQEVDGHALAEAVAARRTLEASG